MKNNVSTIRQTKHQKSFEGYKTKHDTKSLL
jgi:hypothetical protein